MKRDVVRALLLVSLLSAGTMACADDHDHERARTLLEKGEILPLAEIIRQTTARFPGKVLDVDLEEEDGKIVYEIEFLGEDGVVREMDVDARSGRLISVEED